jgi:hypothetical protein
MKLKLWTARWSKYGRDVMGIEDGDQPLISQNPEIHGIKVNVSTNKIGRPKWRDAELYPFFDTKEEAEAFVDMNDHWEVFSVEIDV